MSGEAELAEEERKIVVVTGGAGDLGSAIARELRASGIEAVPADIVPAAGVEHCDVTDRASVDDLVARVLARWGRLDGLVVGAGIATRAGVLDVAPSDWRHVLDVNLTGAFHCAQAVARAMVAAGHGGSIVFVGSWIGTWPATALLPYSVSKAGVDMLARCLALELAGFGIRVNVVAPGVIDAGVSAQIFREAPERRSQMEAVIPAGRLGTACDVATTVAFFFQEGASYVTGANLVVDGGIALAHAGG